MSSRRNCLRSDFLVCFIRRGYKNGVAIVEQFFTRAADFAADDFRCALRPFRFDVVKRGDFGALVACENPRVNVSDITRADDSDFVRVN